VQLLEVGHNETHNDSCNCNDGSVLYGITSMHMLLALSFYDLTVKNDIANTFASYNRTAV